MLVKGKPKAICWFHAIKIHSWILKQKAQLIIKYLFLN